MSKKVKLSVNFVFSWSVNNVRLVIFVRAVEMKHAEEENVPLVAEIAPNGRAQANIISKKWFTYLDPFFSTGWKNGLAENDISMSRDQMITFCFRKFRKKVL